MKKLVSLLLIILLLVTSFSTVDAKSSEISNSTIVISEFDIYLQLKNSTDEQLHSLGFSENEITTLQKFHLEDEILKLAKLSTSVLKAHGYTEYQIQLLKSYDGSDITKNSAIMAASATMTGYFYTGTCNDTSMIIRFSWTWSGIPLMKFTDKIVLAWEAINSLSHEFDALASNYATLVKYFNIDTGSYHHSRTVNGTYQSISSCISFPIDVGESLTYYAKSGISYVTLSPGGNVPFNYVNFAFSYGHAIVSIVPSFQILPNLDISFTPAASVTQSLEVYQSIDAYGQLMD